MRKFVLAYVIVALVFSATTVILQVFPATIVIGWFVESDGRFSLVAVLGLLMLFCLVPLFLIMLIYNLLTAKKQKAQPELLDQTGIIVRRDKAIYGAVFPMDIVINDKKMATVSLGKSRQIVLPMGEYTLKIKAMGKGVERQISLKENRSLIYTVGFRLGGSMQDIYIEEAEAPETV